MNVRIEPQPIDRTCIGCKGTVTGGARVCPACGRDMLPPGDHHPAASAGDEAAQFYLGVQYFYGIDVPRDLAESEKWYRRSAEQGRVAAMNNVGLLCFLKEPPDHAEAARWLRLAAERGDAQAQHVLAGMLQGGLGVPQDRGEAVRWLQAAAAQGYQKAAEALPAFEAELESERLLAEVEPPLPEEEIVLLEPDELLDISLGEAPVTDTSQGLADELKRFTEAAQRGSAELQRVSAILDDVRPLREAADGGDVEAQRTLDERVAVAQQEARGFDEEFQRCRIGAEQGDALAQRRFGEMLRRGAPIVMDMPMLEKWMADLRGWVGDSQARIQAMREGSVEPGSFGEAPPMPRSVLPDPIEAERWLLKAAEQGDAQAQRALGEMFEKGEGVPQDEAESVKWFRMASENGDALAQLRYGFLIWSQHYGTPREEEAVRWLTAAADQGQALAAYTLGSLYDHRRDRPELWALAVPWFRKAAEHGYAQAYFHLAEYNRWDEIMPRNDEEAVRLYRRAFELDPAMLESSRYLNWKWSEQDLAVSIPWFRKYAEQGEAWAREIAEGLEKKVAEGGV